MYGIDTQTFSSIYPHMAFVWHVEDHIPQDGGRAGEMNGWGQDKKVTLI